MKHTGRGNTKSWRVTLTNSWLTNTDNPRNHQFDELDQIIVLLNDPETGEQFYEILTYVNDDFVFGGPNSDPMDFDAPFPGPELMRWEKIDI